MFTRSSFSMFSAIVAPIAALVITLAPGVPAYASPSALPAALDASALSAVEVSSVRISGPASSTTSLSAVEVSSTRVSGASGVRVSGPVARSAGAGAAKSR
jgi:hypothetical protein